MGYKRGMVSARMCCPVEMVNIMCVPTKIPWGTEFYLIDSNLNQCTVSSSPLVWLVGLVCLFSPVNACVNLFCGGRVRGKSSLLRKTLEHVIFPRKGSGSFTQASVEAFGKQTHLPTNSTRYQLWRNTSVQVVEHEVLWAAVGGLWGAAALMMHRDCLGSKFPLCLLTKMLAWGFWFCLYLPPHNSFTSKTSLMCLSFLCFKCSSEQGNWYGRCSSNNKIKYMPWWVIPVYFYFGRWASRLQSGTKTVTAWVPQRLLFLEIRSQLGYEAEGAC